MLCTVIQFCSVSHVGFTLYHIYTATQTPKNVLRGAVKRHPIGNRKTRIVKPDHVAWKTIGTVKVNTAPTLLVYGFVLYACFLALYVYFQMANHAKPL